MNILQALALRGEAESYERQENAWLLEHITKMFKSASSDSIKALFSLISSCNTT